MLTHSFRRPITRQEVSGEEVVKIIAKYIMEDPTARYDFTVGTDSQGFSEHTKFCEVIAVHRVGRGGIFFYNITYTQVIKNLRQKITTETQKSLENANGLLEALQLELIDNDIDIDNIDIRFQIHCDVGKDGRTSEFIKEIYNWVTSYHYECLIKPYSYTASGIADRYSK